MAITIGSSNISSLQAQKSLSDATSKVADAYKQLSSGLRINQASDDAAGLAIATQLNSKARVYNVGIRNVNDAISASTIAEGALNTLKEISQRQLELTEQAANGTYSTKQRNALNTEANALVDEYNRITASTTFNGLSLFDPKLGSVLIQAGNSTLKEGFSDGLARAVGDGTFASAQTYFASTSNGTPISLSLGDVNGDGILDLVGSDYADQYGQSVSVFIGNGNGTFKEGVSYATAGVNPLSVTLSDLDGNGSLDIVTADSYSGANVTVLLNNGDGTYRAAQSYQSIISAPQAVQVGDFNGDGKSDIVTAGSGGATVLLGNGNGTFRAGQLFQPAGGGSNSVTVADFNGDGKLDFATADYTGNDVSVFLGNGTGTFQAARSYRTGGNHPNSVVFEDINSDGILDLLTSDRAGSDVSIFLGNGDGSFGAATTLAVGGLNPTSITTGDFNGDGRADIITTDFTNSYHSDISVIINNGNGTFLAAKTYQTHSSDPTALAIGDINGDLKLDIVTSDYTAGDISVFVGNGTSTSTSKYLNLNSRADALNAQNTVSGNLDRIEKQLGSLGATGSRFQTALNNLQVQSQNFTAAASRIQDADIAQESSVLVRTQILQQAATSVLAQANQQPALALKLLG